MSACHAREWEVNLKKKQKKKKFEMIKQRMKRALRLSHNLEYCAREVGVT